MTPLLEEKLNILSHDDLMLEAITTIVTERIEKEKPDIEVTDNDAIVGQKFRAYEYAKFILKEALNDIRSYKNETNKSNSINKGR